MPTYNPVCHPAAFCDRTIPANGAGVCTRLHHREWIEILRCIICASVIAGFRPVLSPARAPWTDQGRFIMRARTLTVGGNREVLREVQSRRIHSSVLTSMSTVAYPGGKPGPQDSNRLKCCSCTILMGEVEVCCRPHAKWHVLPQNPSCHARLPCQDRPRIPEGGVKMRNADLFITPHSTDNLLSKS